MTKIAIIGAGQLGSRHLQALASLKDSADIYISDPSPVSLNVARERFQQVMPGNHLNAVFCTEIPAHENKFDVAIVATNADVRRHVIEQLLTSHQVQYLVLEKVLFQGIDDYEAVGKLLLEKGVRTWVNCPRRMWPSYNWLKAKISGQKILCVLVHGSNWGLGCNSIHMIDVIAFVSGKTEYTISSQRLSSGSIPAKRQGFVEFTGCLDGCFSDGPIFSLFSSPLGDVPTIIDVVTETSRFIIKEHEQKAWYAEKHGNWIWQEFDFGVPYQSSMTNLLVEELTAIGCCQLTGYDESAALHIPLLQALQSHLVQNEPSRRGKSCPIT